MFNTMEGQTKRGRVEVLWSLARQFGVLVATAALFGSLNLVILIGEREQGRKEHSHGT